MKRQQPHGAARHKVNLRRKGIREDRAAAIQELSGDQNRRDSVYKTDPGLFSAAGDQPRKTYTLEQKLAILAQFDALRADGLTWLQIEGRIEVSTATISAWRRQLKRQAEPQLSPAQLRRREEALDALLWGPQL